MNDAKIEHVKAEAGMKFTDLSIKTDGTVAGTTILLNGKEIKDLSSLRFYLYAGSYGGLELSFNTRTADIKPGEFMQENSYYLYPPTPDKAEAHISCEPPKAKPTTEAEAAKLLTEM